MNKTVHATGIVIEDETGKLLALRRNADTPEGLTWGLAGGEVDKGEESKATAIRKAYGEISYAVHYNDLHFLKTYRWPKDGFDLLFVTYRLRVQSAQMTITLNPDGHSEYAWLRPVALYERDDLIQGFYPILEDFYGAKLPDPAQAHEL